MACHVDVDVLVRAPLALAWAVTNEHESWEASRHRLLDASDDGRRISFQVTTPADSAGRSWTYNVERSQYPERFTVCSRRWGNPEFAYSVAWWLYAEVADGTRIRCVQDFEMAADGGADDSQMERIIRDATRAALQQMTARVEAAAGTDRSEVEPVR